MKTNRVLLVLIIVIGVVSAAELGYYFYLTYFSQRHSKALFIPTAKVDSSAYKELRKTAEPAVHPQMIERLKNYVKSPESRLYILTEQTVKVMEIAKDGATVEDRRDGKLYPGEIFFPYAIKVSNEVMPEGYIWMYFHDPVIKKTSVFYRSQGSENIKADLKDIKVGDTITTIEKWDPSIAPDMAHLQDFLAKQVVDYTIYIEK